MSGPHMKMMRSDRNAHHFNGTLAPCRQGHWPSSMHCSLHSSGSFLLHYAWWEDHCGVVRYYCMLHAVLQGNREGSCNRSPSLSSLVTKHYVILLPPHSNLTLSAMLALDTYSSALFSLSNSCFTISAVLLSPSTPSILIFYALTRSEGCKSLLALVNVKCKKRKMGCEIRLFHFFAQESKYGQWSLKGVCEQGQKQAVTVGGHNFRWNRDSK